ncbi:aquaporin [Phytoactinopolyspora endophytica]|uniref:aquaporin n=1 Tax=Phytoactinopolyspora endophytica TaxID=1642495 RepID=UPI00101DD268|nr:aquaporin [Phytoactinopolyspora endophytica]
MPHVWVRNAVAEGFGAFVLTFVAIMTANADSDITAYALSQGLTIVVLVAALGHVSGGHFNPAVTLAMFLSRRIDIVGASIYWAAQIIGGVLAALAVLAVLSRDTVSAATPDPVTGGDLNMAGAVVLEALAVLLVVVAVIGTIVDQRAPLSAYPIAIGFAYAAGIYAIGGLTGGALNPARAFGPAVVGAEWGGVVSWLVGPLIGAVLAWVVYEFVIGVGAVAPGDAEASDMRPHDAGTGDDAGKDEPEEEDPGDEAVDVVVEADLKPEREALDEGEVPAQDESLDEGEVPDEDEVPAQDEVSAQDEVPAEGERSDEDDADDVEKIDQEDEGSDHEGAQPGAAVVEPGADHDEKPTRPTAPPPPPPPPAR